MFRSDRTPCILIFCKLKLRMSIACHQGNVSISCSWTHFDSLRRPRVFYLRTAEVDCWLSHLIGVRLWLALFFDVHQFFPVDPLPYSFFDGHQEVIRATTENIVVDQNQGPPSCPAPRVNKPKIRKTLFLIVVSFCMVSRFDQGTSLKLTVAVSIFFIFLINE